MIDFLYFWMLKIRGISDIFVMSDIFHVEEIYTSEYSAW
jgi:hypothetical protein